MKILFLCKGNTARSTFAEALYKKLIATDDVMSAGVKLSGQSQTLESRLPDTENVIEAMREEDVDVSGYVRKEVTQRMADNADMIIDMSPQEITPIFVKNHPNRIVWDVSDPKGEDFGFHIKVKEEIKRRLREMFLD